MFDALLDPVMSLAHMPNAKLVRMRMEGSTLTLTLDMSILDLELGT
jgi:hypothetical protein